MKKRDRRVTNWSEYNKALVNRGKRIILCVEEDRLDSWAYSGQQNPGGKVKFTDICILDVMGIKELHNFGYRQLEGFLRAFMKLLRRTDVEIPSYSCIQKRASQIQVPRLNVKIKEGDVIAIDSTGLKVVGQGEWQDYKHKNGKKRWLKVHLLVNVETGEVIDYSLTKDDVGDSTEMINIMERNEIPPNVKVMADGNYDKGKIWSYEDEGKVELIILPRKDAVDGHDSEARNRTVQKIDEYGREKWKYKEDYHYRSKVENVNMRCKKYNQGKIKYRDENIQNLALYLQFKRLNNEIALGMPETKLKIRQIA